jgi:glucan phosphoethanolaminetransferase (alkaline phosphatase superfamily)
MEKIINRISVKLHYYKLLWIFLLMTIFLLPDLYFTLAIDYLTFTHRFFTLLISASFFTVLLFIFRNKLKIFTWIVFAISFVAGSFSLGMLIFYKARLSVNTYAAIVNTNSKEAKEFIDGYQLPVILMWLALILVFILTWKFIPRKLDKKFARRSLLACILMFIISSLYFTRYEKFGYHAYARDIIKEECYPVYCYNAIASYKGEAKKLAKNRRIAEKFSYHAMNADHDSLKKIIVLVIGESCRKQNWSAYGYNRETTPRSEKRKSIVFFTDAVTSHNSTLKSLAIMLTPVSAVNYEDHSKCKSILHLFSEAGFKTYWISNQKDEAARLRIHMEDADSIFCTTGFKSITESFDAVLIPQFKNLLARNENQFFIIHLNGNHLKYEERYPPAFNIFGKDHTNKLGKEGYYNVRSKQQVTDYYDNSILYQDFILDSLISLLETGSKTGCLLYTSDHGEDLFDDCRNLTGHGASFTEASFRVPFFVFATASFEKKYPGKFSILAKNKDKKIAAGEDIFYSLPDLANINFPSQHLAKSISSAEFTEQHKRMILLPDNKVAAFEDEVIKEKELIKKCQ